MKLIRSAAILLFSPFFICDALASVAVAAETEVPKSQITATAAVYSGCGGYRRSCNMVDGAENCYDENDVWGSWECSTQGGQYCDVKFTFSSPKRISTVQIMHKPGDRPNGMWVKFGNKQVYSGGGSNNMTITDPNPQLVSYVEMKETSLPPGDNWWTICEVDFWEGEEVITYIDIGLRIRDGNGNNVRVAAEPEGTLTSPLRIAKNNKIYGIALVSLGAPEDSGIRVQTASGAIMAIRDFDK